MDRCALCPRIHNIVPADGPAQCRILCIGEAPGQTEDRVLRPFSGQAGMEYNDNYLPLAGLHRSEIRQTNTVLCRPEQNKTPSDELARCCSEHHLIVELMECQPEIVLLLGATATNTLCPGADLESQHGIPFKGSVLGYECWIVCLYHPAAGLHQTALMIPLLEDFERLKPWLETGEWQWGIDVVPTRDYRLARTMIEVNNYFRDYGCSDYFGCDTESHAGVDFSMQISLKPGTGLMVLMTDHEAVQELSDHLSVMMGSFFELVPVFHNAEADLDLFSQVAGFRIDLYRDTMAEAYQLQNLPQKLKALSYRLLGRKRQSWMEIVGGYSREKLMEWMWQAKEIAESECRIITERVSDKTGKRLKDKVSKSELESVLNRIMMHTSKPQSGDSPYDPWKKFKEIEPTFQYQLDMQRIVDRLGPMPQLGIANCPLDVARDYGCADADDTLALAYELDRLRKDAETGWNVQDQDIDRPRVEMSL